MLMFILHSLDLLSRLLATSIHMSYFVFLKVIFFYVYGSAHHLHEVPIDEKGSDS